MILHSRPLFTNSDGSLKKEGDVVINSELGQTFRTIAEEGMSAFYTGKLADDILADIRDAPAGMPSLIKKDDLQNYKYILSVFDNILYTTSATWPSPGNSFRFHVYPQCTFTGLNLLILERTYAT